MADDRRVSNWRLSLDRRRATDVLTRDMLLRRIAARLTELFDAGPARFSGVTPGLDRAVSVGDLRIIREAVDEELRRAWHEGARHLTETPPRAEDV